MEKNEVLLKEDGKIFIDENHAINVLYPKYWNKKFINDNRKMLRIISNQVREGFILELLTDAQSVFNAFYKIEELNFVESVNLSKRWESILNKVAILERQTIHYRDDRNASIKIDTFFKGKLDLSKIKTSDNSVSLYPYRNDLCYEDDSVLDDNILIKTKGYMSTVTFMTFYLMPKFFEAVHNAIINKKDFKLGYGKNNSKFDEKSIFKEILEFINNNTYQNKSIDIRTLKNENNETMLSYALKYEMIKYPFGVFNTELLEMALEFQKPIKQVKGYFERRKKKEILKQHNLYGISGF